jgi:hypothetical protein
MRCFRRPSVGGQMPIKCTELLVEAMQKKVS